MDANALRTLLETDPAIDAMVTEGRNGAIVVYLNEPEPSAQPVWQDVAVDDFLNAIAGSSLTVVQEARIQTYTAQRERVPTSRQNVRDWLQSNMPAPARAALAGLAARQPTRAEAAGVCVVGEAVGLWHVREAVRSIAKGALSTKESADRQATADRLTRMRAQAVKDGFDPDETDPSKASPILMATSRANFTEKADV